MNEPDATRRRMLIGAALAAAPLSRADAQTPPPTPGPSGGAMSTTRANAGTVGIISGGVEGTYIRIAADLAAVLDDGDRLRVLPVVGKGSVQNLSDIIYLRGIDIGIVQSDALTFALRENLFPGVAQTINYVAKLYDEEIHVLARPEIKTVQDLAGKKVNVDVRGSGTAMTSSVVFGKLGVKVEPIYDSQSNALKHLRDGDVAALVYVTGKPATLFSGIGPDSGLHFLDLPTTAALVETYLPAQLSHAAYPNLVAENAPVDTLAVGAVMAVFGWQPGSDRYKRVVTFLNALTGHFAQLQVPPRHPKWREVSLAAKIPGWTRFPWTPEPAQPPHGGAPGGRAARL